MLKPKFSNRWIDGPMAIAIKEKPAWLVESEVDWRKVRELFKTGQYELVAELLYQVQITSECTGNVILANTAAAAPVDHPPPYVRGRWR